MDARPVPVPPRRPGRPAADPRPPMECTAYAFSSLACAGWLAARASPPAVRPSPSEGACERHVGGRAGSCSTRSASWRGRASAPSLSRPGAEREAGRWGHGVRIYDSPRDWTDRVSGRSLSRPARWGSLGLTDGRTGASPDIHSLFPPLPRDGWQAARELRSSARPSVRHHCASLLAAVRTRLAARTRPYGFLLHVCTVCTTRQGDRSIVPTQVQVSQHRMSRSNAGAGYEFRIFHRFLLASYLSGPKMVTFRDRLASARCPR